MSTTLDLEPERAAEILIGRARELVATVRERAAEAESARRIPAATIADLRDAGLFKILQPSEVGGSDAPFGTHTRVAFELGRGCPSTAWVLSVLNGHNWAVGMMDPRAAHAVWDDDPDARISSASNVAPGLVRKVGDAFEIDGQFGFSSGVDHCSWLIVQAMHYDSASPMPDMRYFLVPMSDVEVLDTWHTSGLAATGSNDVRIQSVVPEHRTLPWFTAQGQPSAGSAEFAAPAYRITMPFMPIYPYTLVGATVGAAQGTLEAFCETAKTRRMPPTGMPLSESEHTQITVAQASAEIDSARLLLTSNLDRINKLCDAGLKPAPLDVMRHARDIGYTARVCVQAADRLQADAGAHSIFTANPLQRQWRDVHAITSHIALGWPRPASAYGKALLEN